MFGGKKGSLAKIDTLVGINTTVEGNVIFTGGLHVDGCIKGNVIAEQGTLSVLTLSENGRIEGQINVPHVILNGAVHGDVHSVERVVLASRAQITGNVYYELIEMAIGASVNGNLIHADDSKQKLITHTDTSANDSEPESESESDNKAATNS